MEDLLQMGADYVAETDWSAVGNEALNEAVNYANQVMVANGITDPAELIYALVAIVTAVAAVIIGIVVVIACIVFFCWLIICGICLLLIFLQEYLFPAIALFNMARRAGYPHPWFAFLPFLQTYLEFELPKKEYRVFFIRLSAKQRYIIAIIDIAAASVSFAASELFTLIPFIGWFLGISVLVFLIAFRYRKMYDLIRTYTDRNKAVVISVFSLFVPMVYAISLLVLMNREPDFGYMNYLADEPDKTKQDENRKIKNEE